MKTKYFIIFLTILGLFSGTVLIYNQISLKKPSLNIKNSAPYHIDFYTIIKFTNGSSISRGPYMLSPGEKRSFNWEFDDEPEIYIFHKSSNQDEELLKWSLDLPYPQKGTRTIHSNNYETMTTKLNEAEDTVQFSKMKITRKGFLFKKSTFEYESRDKEVFSVFTNIAENYNINILNSNSSELYQRVMDVFENDAEFVVKNATPFDIYFAVNFQYTKDVHQTIGWYSLKSGESTTFNQTFYGVHPQISIYGKTANNNQKLVKLAYNLNSNHEGILHFQGIEGNPSIFKPIVEGDKFDLTTIQNDYQSEKNSIPVQFSTVYSAKMDDVFEFSETSFEFTDNSFPEIYMDEDKVKWLDKAKAVNRSLMRQVKYDESIYSIKDMPYILGLNLYDEKGISDLGITINNVIFSKNIIGQDNPFKNGDKLLTFAGEEVFTNKDLTILLNEHATSIDGGIGVPIPFTILRNGELLKGNTLYFFNPQYNWPSDDWWLSILVGIADALTLGFDYNAYKSLTQSNPKKAWNYLQYKSRVRQLHSEYFLVGNLGGAILSPGRLLLQKPAKRALSRIGVKGGLSSIASTVGLEVAEGIVWTYGGSSPLLTKKEFSEMLKDEIKFTAGMGFAIGSLNRVIKN